MSCGLSKEPGEVRQVLLFYIYYELEILSRIEISGE